MIVVREHGAVREIEMSTRLSRLVGFKVSAFLHRGVLIDTGFPRARAELMAALDRHAVTGAIVTHWHEDHAGNLSALVARGLPVSVSEQTLALHRARPTVPYFRWAIWGHPRPDPNMRPVPVEHPFQLIPTPGHSPDHLAVFDPEERIAFTGDLFLGVRACVVHDYESPSDTIASLRRIVALEPRVVFDAHRGRIDEPRRLFGAKIEWLEETMAAIRRLAESGRSDLEIVKAVFGAEDRAAFVSRGDVSKQNFVRIVRRGMPGLTGHSALSS